MATVRIKSRDALVALLIVVALANLSSTSRVRGTDEGWADRADSSDGTSDGPPGGGPGVGAGRVARGDWRDDGEAREKTPRGRSEPEGGRARDARDASRGGHGSGGGGGDRRYRYQARGAGSSSSSAQPTSLRASALAKMKAPPDRATRAERLLDKSLGAFTSEIFDKRNGTIDVGALRAEALAAGIPDEDEIEGNAGGSKIGGDVSVRGGGGGHADENGMDPGHDLVEEERQHQQKPVDKRDAAQELPHDTMSKIFKEELSGEAETTEDELLAAEDATAAAEGAAGGRDSSSLGSSAIETSSDEDRATRLHKLHPDKYDAFGQIRESFLLHHLPRPPLTCPKIKGVMPTLLGLPVMLPDIISYRDMFVHRANYARLLGNRALTPEAIRALPPNADAIMRRYGFKTCAVVGNSGGLNDAKLGKDVDSHDIVVRLNVAPVNGHEEKVGSKTSFRILNTLWSARYGSMKRGAPWAKKSEEIPLEHGATLVFTRFEPAHFVDMVDFLASHGRKDITVLMLSSRVVSMVHLLEAHYRNRLCRQGYGPYPGGQTPSSGLVAVYVMMQVCRKVTAYGFGGVAGEVNGGVIGASTAKERVAAMSKRPPPYHYWKGTGARAVGNEDSHSFNTEAHLIQELLSPTRKHPAAGHPWFNPELAAVKNLRVCPSVANPHAVGHQRCARGGGVGGNAGAGSESGRGGVPKIRAMSS